MVMVEGLGGILSSHPFFADMDPAAMEVVKGCCSNAVFRPGSYVFRRGDPANLFYLIREGMVALEIYVPGREPIVVETLEAGEIFGWSWLIPPYVWSNDARAVETTRLLQLDAACLRQKMETDRVLGYEIYKRFVPVMAGRLAGNRMRIVELATEPAG